ncbi:PoNe immunity protein domain-containing protein [Chitinibacter sp. ZOR0017]|uniref:PoNe immunity protein domain-containing protein n=1 Tax=Chitinibacter sp. ZOR0017 TaxID=1339254 RepID=UPI000646DFBA|nr:PoNe immunity protein domain-containing protein [Chitinibacter sp. ZOR0017]
MSFFIERHRQVFLAEKYYSSLKIGKIDSHERFSLGLQRESNDSEDISRLNWAISDNSYEILSLAYTAGEAIYPLRDQLESVIVTCVKYAIALREYEQSVTCPVFGLQYIDEFERIAQLIGLAYLLHRRDLIPRIHALIAGSAYDGVDAMYEVLISHALPDRPYLENWYHQKPYIHLLNATDLETEAEKSEQLKEYCLAWYPAMVEAPWHNSHLNMTETDGAYFGYWAFEAGAIAYLYNIDHSEIDHMVYPKDLVAFAREFEAEPEKFNRARCPAKQACPQSGYWYTPVKQNSRALFKQGDVMPDYPDSTYGATIWYWDQNQG